MAALADLRQDRDDHPFCKGQIELFWWMDKGGQIHCPACHLSSFLPPLNWQHERLEQNKARIQGLD